MRRSSMFGADPNQDNGFLARLRATVTELLARTGRHRQAMPLDHYHGQSGPVVPYQERRQQHLRARRRQHSSYALVFVLVLLVLVVGIFYGLAWALGGGLSFGGGERPTPTAVAQPTAPASAPTAAPPAVTLPTPAPGGTSPSPSPGPVGSPPAGAQPSPGPGTPAPGPTSGRTYTVKAGDTPGAIARQFNISPEALMRANNITDARTLRAGQELVIPPESTPTPASR